MKKKRWLLNLFLILSLLSILAQTAKRGNSGRSAPSRDPFDRVVIGRLEESAASPQIDMKTFEGIRITTPAKRSLASERPFPVCGTWVFWESALWKIPHVEDELKFEVHNTDTGEVAAAGNLKPKPVVFPKVTRPYVADPKHPEGKVQGWFNYELRGLWPTAKPGHYSIKVSVRDQVSNEAAFEILAP